MADNNMGFSDPLDSIVNRIKEKESKSTTGGTLNIPESNVTVDTGKSYTVENDVPTAKAVEPKPTPSAFPTFEDTIIDDAEVAADPDVNYGDDDADAEIAAAERHEAEELAKKREEARIAAEQNKPFDLPHNSLDADAVAEDLDHQGGNAILVGKMVQQVARDYKLPSGGVPEYDPRYPAREKVQLKFPVMGELMAEYIKHGEVITPRFVDLILDNWYLDSGITARQFVENGYKDVKDLEKESTNNHHQKNDDSDNNADADKKEEEKEKNPTVNINVAPQTPVTVNVDDSLTANIQHTKVIDVYVNEVTEETMRASRVYNNPKLSSVITPYDPGLQDIPVTLPVSGYRVIMRPISWMETVALIAPTAPNITAVLLKQWSIIYNHIKWTSIGMFESFDDFMSKTKYVDLQFFMWALLVASSKDEEEVQLSCGDKDCKYTVSKTYRPREIIRIDEELIPAYYDEVDKAGEGVDALEIFNRVHNTKRTYELPHTKSIFEFDSPTAKEFLEVKYPRMRDIFNKYYPGEDFDKAFPNIMKLMQEGNFQGGEFALMFGAASIISAASVKNLDKDEEYRYTDWDKIEEIIRTHLDFGDCYILFNQLFPENSNIYVSPVSFALDGFVCPICGRDNTNVPIDDIGQALLFLLSRGYENTKINLIEKQQKF